MNFPFYKQLDQMDCGPTCLRMVASHYGKVFPLSQFRELSSTTIEGSSFLGLSEAAEKIGFKTLSVKITTKQLIKEAPLPCIVHWNQNHFVIVYKTSSNALKVADPAHGLLKYSVAEFNRHWLSDADKGVALLIEPTPSFYSQKDELVIQPDKEVNNKSFSQLFQYLFRYKQLLIQLFIGLGVGSALNLIFPFLTQSIVDIGINNRDINFIYIILLAQLFLFSGRISIEVIRSWILLHLTTRINISLISDFFIKLMKLPIGFFDVKMTGDIMQRISDHHRIQSFLTGTTLNTLFSILNLLILSAVVFFYSPKIFVIFFVGSIIYMLWIMLFLKRRRNLDYKRFNQLATNQSQVLEMITGMQEIKLHNAERQKRWEWEFLQAKIFKINIKNLTLEQTQQIGSTIINELKNIFITIISASLVINGEITLGMMLSLSYMLGQLNSPIAQFIDVIHNYQDAKISLERLGEIHNKEDEEQIDHGKINLATSFASIEINDLHFKYNGAGFPEVLKNVTLTIPENSITAIVGASGSGKSTLMKLLLKFYEPSKGSIQLKQTNFKNISNKWWRDQCGSVMQEGYIFSDTISNNIAVGMDKIDRERLEHAMQVANIKDFVDELPLGTNTKIGREGLGISTGQKQRILIARAVYKNPSYFFLDEATSALDANNEKIIMENLAGFFIGRTVVIIAHRLSTVKNAEQIIVLDKGEVVEIGNHKDLVAKQGYYFNLVKNQLELGN